ncbi:hypothetical protein V8D89_010493 [Ganoderma adspersum]
MPPAYLIALVVVLGVVVLGGAFYIYRQERRLESIAMSRAGKTDDARPWSWQFLINETDLEGGPEVEGEDDIDSLHYRPPMTVEDPSLPIIPPLAFDDAQLVPQPEDPQALLSPQSTPAGLPAQPSAALLSKSHTRRGSDTVALARGIPGVRDVAYPHNTDGVESVRSSVTSSILPPSYCSRYPDPGNPQNDPVAPWYQWPTSGEGESQGESVEEEDGTGRPRRRSFDGGIRLAGGRPGEGDSAAASGADEAAMPPTYHDS